MARTPPKIELRDGEKERLKQIIASGVNWRERDRAETILLLAEGRSAREVAIQQGLCLEAVRVRRRKWLKLKFESLKDASRSGAPKKLSQEHREALNAWLKGESLTLRSLRSRLDAEYGVQVSVGTVRTALKQLGFVWKQTRRSIAEADSITSNATA